VKTTTRKPLQRRLVDDVQRLLITVLTKHGGFSNRAIARRVCGLAVPRIGEPVKKPKRTGQPLQVIFCMWSRPRYWMVTDKEEIAVESLDTARRYAEKQGYAGIKIKPD